MAAIHPKDEKREIHLDIQELTGYAYPVQT